MGCVSYSQRVQYNYSTEIVHSGHVRPLIHLSARFVKLRPAAVVTLLTSNGWLERVQTELAASFERGDEECAKRIRYSSGLLLSSDAC